MWAGSPKLDLQPAGLPEPDLRRQHWQFVHLYQRMVHKRQRAIRLIRRHRIQLLVLGYAASLGIPVITSGMDAVSSLLVLIMNNEIQWLTQQAGMARWGTAPGSVIIHGQKVPVDRPRLRGQRKEAKLGSDDLFRREGGNAATGMGQSRAAPAVWFAYSPDRKGEHPHRHLKTFCGTLQADGYAGFNRLYGDGRIREVACWAQVRRKFFDLRQAHASPIATEAVERIGQLYRIESEIRGRPPDERQQVRDQRARPLFIVLHE